MIDLHCHLLPGVDDGAKDLEESLAMARLAVNDGIRAIVATPHVRNGLYHHTREELEERFIRLKEYLQVQGLPLTLYLGADIHLSPGLIQHLERQELPSINNRRYLLLELPSFALPSALQEILFKLRAKGFIPVVTHPERNGAIQKNPEQAVELSRFGALFQVTAMSLTGEFGGKVRDCAAALLEKGLVQVLATDAHSPRNRPPFLAAGVRAAEKLIGKEAALRLVTDHPERILAGAPWPDQEFQKKPESSRLKKLPFFARLLR
ncbi:MAG: capsular biosynthesis protein [Deltaproteobacteria bacterium]|nr:capsular biosynthesis protein [Deltaproteobacteria bacterium]